MDWVDRVAMGEMMLALCKLKVITYSDRREIAWEFYVRDEVDELR